MSTKTIRTPSYWQELHQKLIQGCREGRSLSQIFKEEGVRANVASYNFRRLGLTTKIKEAAGVGHSPTGGHANRTGVMRPMGFVKFVPEGMNHKPRIEVILGDKTRIYCDNDDIQGLKTIMSCCVLGA